MDVAGAVRHEHPRPIGEGVLRVGEVEDATPPARIVGAPPGDLVAARGEVARLGGEARTATLEVQDDPGRVGFAHPEAPVAAVGAHAVVATGDLLPHACLDRATVRSVVAAGRRSIGRLGLDSAVLGLGSPALGLLDRRVDGPGAIGVGSSLDLR